jgi:hypothetical protein
MFYWLTEKEKNYFDFVSLEIKESFQGSPGYHDDDSDDDDDNVGMLKSFSLEKQSIVSCAVKINQSPMGESNEIGRAVLIDESTMVCVCGV